MPFLIPNSEDFLKASEILGPRLADTIFQPYAEKRQPRALEMIREARAQGNLRVIADPEMCKSCDEMIAAWWKDSDAIAAKYDGLLREPYESLESLLAPGDDHEAKD
jgi:salicylate hydroxylase